MDENQRGRIYAIQSGPPYFYAGRLENGHQVLMGVQLPELVMVEFDAQGNYLGASARAIAHEIPRSAFGTYQMDEDKLSEELGAWQSELGFKSGAISVRRFFLPDRGIGIQDLPDHYQDVLDRPQDYSDDERVELMEDIRQWLEDGDFVFYWVEDYYLAQDGELASS